MVTKLLKLTELEDGDHMSDVEDRPRWIDPKLDTEWLPRCELGSESFFIDDLRDSFLEEGIECVGHVCLI